MSEFEVLFVGPVFDDPPPDHSPRLWRLDKVNTTGPMAGGRAGDVVGVVLYSLDGRAIYGEPYDEFVRFWRPIVAEKETVRP